MLLIRTLWALQVITTAKGHYGVIIFVLQSFDFLFFFRDFRFGTTGVLGGTIIDSCVRDVASSSKLNLSTISSHTLDELSSLNIQT